MRGAFTLSYDFTSLKTYGLSLFCMIESMPKIEFEVDTESEQKFVKTCAVQYIVPGAKQ